MPEQSSPNSPSEPFGNVPQPSEAFGKVLNDSESFRTVPKDSENFGSLPHITEKRANHTLTVREAARMFETAGVARTERSITNWCQPNRQGVTRLDCYFDPNERKYYLTPESVERAIAEEQARAIKPGEAPAKVESTEPDQKRTPKDLLRAKGADEIRELELQVRDLEIASRVKDGVIEMKDKAIARLEETQRQYVERLIDSSHRIGELETRLLQLPGPDERRVIGGMPPTTSA